MEYKKAQNISIDHRAAGRKLFQFLESFLNKQVPKSAVMKWIRTGQVRVDGKRAKPFDRLREGQVVRIPPYRREYRNIIDKEERNPYLLKKIYEDDNFMVLYKPPNLATQPGKNLKDSLYTRLKKEYPENTPFLVHRLDKDTSGLILVAKRFYYLQYLQSLFLSKTVKKIYLAWIKGTPKWENWTIIKDTFEEQRNSKIKKVEAIRYVKTLKNIEKNSLVAVFLKTGRKHQIRIQLSMRNHPIIGDKKYSNEKNKSCLLLHSYMINWDEYSFCCLPEHWKGKFKVSLKDVEKIYPLPE